jgi:branched-chain amino acid transport system substrate-binding protein
MKKSFLRGILGLAAAAVLSGGVAGDVGAAEPIRIGSPLLLSGHGAFVGGAEKNTLEMMRDEVNAAGGINGRPLEFVFYDTEAKPDVAVRLIKRLIQKDKVTAILGISASWVALPIIPIVEKAGVPTIIPASTDQIVTPVRKYVFKTPAGDGVVVDKLLQHMKANGIARIALVTTQDGYGSGGHDQFIKQSPNYGVKVVFDDRFTMEDSDITPMLNRIKKTDAQAVVNWSARRAPVSMTMNYRQIGLKLPLYHGHASLSKGYLKATGKNSDGTITASAKFYGSETLPDSDPQKAVIQGYRKAYKAKFGKDANQFGAAAFDAFNILIAAMKKSGPDQAKLREAIEQTTNYVGISGVFNYSASDHGGLSKDNLVMYQASGGAWNLLK